MKLFGHPVHMMLLHFPAALLPMEMVCYGILFFTGDKHFALPAFYAMSGGIVLGWLAIITGATDLLAIPRSKADVIKRALLHGSINTIVLTGYSVFWYIGLSKHDIYSTSIAVLIIKLALITLLFVGNYFGGNLVLKDKIGTSP
jgi:uncharacterized membrane protein